MNFFGALFSGEWSSFLTIFSVWLVASYALGWLFEGPWKKDDVGEGESCLTFLLYLLVIGVYRVVNWFGRLVFRIK
ncbi:hypothetical protein [Metabacillus iocasae]|uniref:Uncharacterized protein n=1 Tax=Priestia iocasae TaxID=2291674 RepID=A0ABS2QVJ8_9BACI|nr:hypothetical protein [Metabacillus iocasae]MBM7703500.1 hypothetical protein [Metabacillus iocasae]